MPKHGQLIKYENMKIWGKYLFNFFAFELKLLSYLSASCEPNSTENFFQKNFKQKQLTRERGKFWTFNFWQECQQNRKYFFFFAILFHEKLIFNSIGKVSS